MKPKTPRNIDVLLNSEAQQALRNAVRKLPEESLSLSWRSELNEKLRKVQPIPWWKVRFVRAWRPALGVALAGCLAMIVTFRLMPEQHHPKDQTLEANLVSSYLDSANSEVVAGPGLAAHEISDTTRSSDTSTDWTESDLNSL